MTITIRQGDCRDVLPTLEAESVQCVITSPPYFGLRQYQGVEPSVWGGQVTDCAHVWGVQHRRSLEVGSRRKPVLDAASKRKPTHQDAYAPAKHTTTNQFCHICGAWRGCLGLEPRPFCSNVLIGEPGCGQCYLCHLVDIFALVWRVLRPDGVVFLNIGDSYTSTPPGNKTKGVSAKSTLHGVNGASGRYRDTLSKSVQQKRNTIAAGLKPKDLCLIPQRLAIALQAWGWYVRSEVIEEVELYCPCGCGYTLEERIWRYDQDREIIWHKPNPMPESVQDRPTRSHEQVWVLTKRATYFWDQEAVREDFTGHIQGQRGHGWHNKDAGQVHAPSARNTLKRHAGAGRNLRSVLTLTTAPFPDAHFATFPPKLVDTCLKAGTSERGACGACGTPWQRVVETIREKDPARHTGRAAVGNHDRMDGSWPRMLTASHTTGWQPGCACQADVVPCTVLDPFAGSGTVGLVADRLGRHAVLIEASPAYVQLARQRLAADAPLFTAYLAEPR